MDRHLILIGLPGSGKSTVGPLVAAALEVPFVDLDALIIRQMSMPVDQIFGAFGEARFREIEREVMAAQLVALPQVLAPGGGWAAHSGNLEASRAAARLCYLKVQSPIALARAREGAVRPLLRGGEGLERMQTLLTERQAYYERADATIENDGTDPATAAAKIVAWIRGTGVA